jgi:hypothetical protein
MQYPSHNLATVLSLPPPAPVAIQMDYTSYMYLSGSCLPYSTAVPGPWLPGNCKSSITTSLPPVLPLTYFHPARGFCYKHKSLLLQTTQCCHSRQGDAAEETCRVWSINLSGLAPNSLPFANLASSPSWNLEMILPASVAVCQFL